MPVVSLEEKSVSGVDLGQVAHLLGLEFDANPLLDPSELVERLDLFLSAIEVVAPQISSGVLIKKLPRRDRTVLELLHHTVEVAQPVTGKIETLETDPANVQSESDTPILIADLREAIHRTRRELKYPLKDWQSTVKTYYGPQTRHQILERCTWHIAQHLRQLEHFVTEWQPEILGWPTDTDYRDLPLPKSVWDD